MNQFSTVTLALLLLMPLAGCKDMVQAPAPQQPHYNNSNPSAETPISDGGKWINAKTATGNNAYSDVQVDASHHIIGNQVSNVDGSQHRVSDGQPAQAADFNDSLALLSGNWPSNHCAQATVFIGPTINAIHAEVELFLRAKINGGTFTGYEVQFSVISSGSYWRVAPRLGNDFLGFGNSIASTPLGRTLQDGDVLKACVVDTTFTISVNNIVIGTGNDSTIATGAPGVGFYHDFSANTHDNQWGFKNFAAN